MRLAVSMDVSVSQRSIMSPTERNTQCVVMLQTTETLAVTLALCGRG